MHSTLIDTRPHRDLVGVVLLIDMGPIILFDNVVVVMVVVVLLRVPGTDITRQLALVIIHVHKCSIVRTVGEL